MGTDLIVGGGFQDGDGNPLALGLAYLKLSADATDSETGTQQICSGQSVIFSLDSDGDVSENSFLWPNDQLISNVSGISDTFYFMSAEDENGQLVYGPNAFFLNSTDATSYVIRELLEPTGSQTVYTLTEIPLTNSLFVFRNGLFMTQGIDFSLSGATLTLFSAPLSSDVVTAVYTDSSIPAAAAPTFQAESFSPGSTVYTLGDTPVGGTVCVFQNGAFQSPSVDYKISGSTITFLTTTFGALRVVYQTASEYVGTTGQVPNSGTSTAMFSLSAIPDSLSLQLYVGGLFQTPGVNFDYLLSGNQITFNSGSIPAPGSVLFAQFNVPMIINLSTLVPMNPAF